jgi:hypothetical protein
MNKSSKIVPDRQHCFSTNFLFGSTGKLYAKEKEKRLSQMHVKAFETASNSGGNPNYFFSA